MFRKRKIETIVLKKIIPDKEISRYNMPFTYEFKGTDGKDYVILWEYYSCNNLEIKVFDLQNNRVLNAQLISEFKNVDKYWKLSHIELKINERRRTGIGTAMLKAFFELILYDDREFTKVSGDFVPLEEPENVEKFYQSFDGYLTSNKTRINMKKEGDKIIFTFS